MAKGNGTTRIGSPASPLGLVSVPVSPKSAKGFNKEYIVDGERYDYGTIAEKYPEQARQIKEKIKSIASEMNENLIGKKVGQVIDEGKPIEIEFSSKNNKEFARQAMMTLSGKYFSEKEMIGIDKILKKAKYVPSSHINTHDESDKTTLWFTYKDTTRDSIWFKVKRDMSGGGKYYLYSLTDKRE